MMKSENSESTSLNKFISDTGRCSRRQADEIIRAGRVRINDVVARPGNRVEPGDKVTIDGKAIEAADKSGYVYIALNKPVGIECTTDQRVEGNIIDFLGYPERIFPIGRLDKPSEGLILLTNHGDIVNKILRARNAHEKEYIVSVNKPITSAFLKKMATGVPILDTVTLPCFIEKIDKFKFRMILTQGLNRQIRRMCKKLGYEVTGLKRVRIMNIRLGGLKTGKWRYLNKSELGELKAMLRHSDK